MEQNLFLKEQLKLKAADFVTAYNREHCDTVLWRTPIFGFADAEDEKIVELKEKVIPGHYLPSDLLEGARSVVVIFVPFTKEVIDSNTGGEFASVLWDRAYTCTNEMLAALNTYLCDFLTEQGFASAWKLPKEEEDERAVSSFWSHRHLGVISGLGTFGINNMLITEKGCAGRLASFVSVYDFSKNDPLTEELCPAKKDGSCCQCVAGCPVQAISAQAETFVLEKEKCVYQIYDRKRDDFPKDYCGETCGKCSCGVFCSYRE